MEKVRRKIKQTSKADKIKYQRILSGLRGINRLKGRAKVEFEASALVSSGLFSKEYYLAHNKDVRDAGVEPIKHYMEYGASELRKPSELFEPGFYLLKNNLLGQTSINPIKHFLETKPNKIDAYSTKEKDFYLEQLLSEACSDNNSASVVMTSMDWEGDLQQRPHHIARKLAERNILVIYIDRHAIVSRKLATNLYLFKEDDIIKDFAKKYYKNKYYWLFSTWDIEQKTVSEYSKLGYKLIYDYIDEIDEEISGDIKNQLNNFNNIARLNPYIAIASASKLRKQLMLMFENKEVLMCQNAVNVNHFDANMITKGKTPEDIKYVLNQGKPLVGYYGAIAPWLDYDLINNMTKQRADLNFVFIGVDYNGGLSNLIIRDNVHYLGPKDYKVLPTYSCWFDVAIIPFKVGEIAKTTSPVKLFEYMAMGIPTVCTKDLQECKGYDYVYISNNTREFYNNIDGAIKARKSKAVRNKLIEQAGQNTWESRVELIVTEIDKLSQESKKGIK